MKVKLFYKTNDNQFFSTKEIITIKRAKELSKKLLKNNSNIVEIYLKWFDGWHYQKVKTIYKGDKND